MMAYNFETDPFAWKTDAPASRANVWFAWRWFAGGTVRYDKVLVRLDSSLRSNVPLPLHLLSDEALFNKLQATAVAETKDSCCPCEYLGKWTDTGYKPDPKQWEVEGRKAHEQIWIEYSHVRHADANKPLRAAIRADNCIDRCRCAANPLVVP